MCQPEFVRFNPHFIRNVKTSPDSPVLLLLDNHASHLSVEALDVAAANGIHTLSFPPHCSNKLQPLDVSVYGPVKTYYKSQCSAWQKNNANQVLEIRYIPGLVCATLNKSLTPSIIKAGFKSTVLLILMYSVKRISFKPLSRMHKKLLLKMVSVKTSNGALF